MTIEISQCLRKIEFNGDKYKLKRTITAINTSLHEEESGLVVGQCKALIETLCKSILREEGKEIDQNINMSRLAKQAVTALGIEKTGNQDQKTREAFIKLINSFASQLENAAGAIGTLRNEYCPLAHGRGHDEPKLHMIYAGLVASQTDSLATFILELIDQRKNFQAEVIYSENDDYNEYLYEQFGTLDIYGDIYEASEILFNLKPTTYRRGLEEYREGSIDDE